MLKIIANQEKYEIKSMSLGKKSRSWIMLRVGGNTGVWHPHLPGQGGKVDRCRHYEE